MMATRNNSGFIGKNKRAPREGSTATPPDITGSATVDGKDYWLDGYRHEKGYRLTFKLKQPRAGATAKGEPPSRGGPPERVAVSRGEPPARVAVAKRPAERQGAPQEPEKVGAAPGAPLAVKAPGRRSGGTGRPF
jgi:hypothetical protein